jgi:hypothetical protein
MAHRFGPALPRTSGPAATPGEPPQHPKAWSSPFRFPYLQGRIRRPSLAEANGQDLLGNSSPTTRRELQAVTASISIPRGFHTLMSILSGTEGP